MHNPSTREVEAPREIASYTHSIVNMTWLVSRRVQSLYSRNSRNWRVIATREIEATREIASYTHLYMRHGFLIRHDLFLGVSGLYIREIREIDE